MKTRFKPEKQLHFVREWREHRGLTIEEVAANANVSVGSISNIENNKQWPSKNMAIDLAQALNCTVADLFSRNPLDPSPLWAIWEKIADNDKEQALKVLRTFEQKVS